MENTGVNWADHTFNGWMGCTKPKDGHECKFCYAERDMDHWLGKVKWGPSGARIRTSEAYWKQPLKWAKRSWFECPGCGGWRGPKTAVGTCPDCNSTLRLTRQRVFAYSLGDLFEQKPNQPELAVWRSDFFRLVEKTCHSLDWMFLTKRPENIVPMIEEAQEAAGVGINARVWLIRTGVWVGTTVGHPDGLWRLDELRKVPALVRFLSAEPLLADLGEINLDGIHQVIVGGESGRSARLTNPDWARSLRRQCVHANVNFFFKQWGEWVHESQVPDASASLLSDDKYSLSHCVHTNQDVGLMARRSYWRIHTNGGFDYYRLGKHATGRLIDGVEWNQVPKSPLMPQISGPIFVRGEAAPIIL